MNNNNTEIKKQSERFKQVIDSIKENEQISQNTISLEIDVSESLICKYKKGHNPIPEHILDKLSDKFGINKDYVRLKSDKIRRPKSIMLNNLEGFVDSWETVTKGDKQYLHFTLDRHFYDFLLDVDKVKLFSEDGISSYEEEVKNLDDLHSANPQLEEFVLIPRNNLIEILQEFTPKRKKLAEVIDLSEHEHYIKE